MNPADRDSDPTPPTDPRETGNGQGQETFGEVGHYADEHDAHEHALIVLAMKGGVLVEPSPDDGGFRLLAESPALPRVRGEIEAYDAEQRETASESGTTPSPGDPDALPPHPVGLLWIALWCAILIATFLMQQARPGFTDLGSSVAGWPRDGWWRPFTAMFLHADLPHLVSNLVGGGVLAALVSVSIGAHRAWPLVLLCGTLANLTTSLTSPDPLFQSIGASTAVFGALGLLSGIGLEATLHSRTRKAWIPLLSPVLAGLVVLGLTGSAAPGSHIDGIGHAAGFAAGVLGGAPSARWLRNHQVRMTCA